MHGTKKPITYWFKAMWWFTTRKAGVNAINLKELLDLGSYDTAWTWLQKLRRCTIRKDRAKLSGTVEVDDFVLGGHKSGKRGRGAEGKTIALAAVEKQGRRLGRIRLQVCQDCSSDSLMPFIEQNIESGSHIITDGWKGYNPIATGDYRHQKVYWTQHADKSSVLPGVHLVVSLLKRVMLGTFQGRFERKHLQSYLNEYVFRFNRRRSKSVGKKFMRIVQQVITSINISRNQVISCEMPAALLAN
jgi:transposase-like protein